MEFIWINFQLSLHFRVKSYCPKSGQNSIYCAWTWPITFDFQNKLFLKADGIGNAYFRLVHSAANQAQKTATYGEGMSQVVRVVSQYGTSISFLQQGRKYD